MPSLHFPVLRYYSLFARKCLIGRGESGGLSALDLAILRHALLRDRTFSLGAMVAKRLSLNRTKGPIFGGIFTSRLARRFEIPIRHDEKEEKLLPTIYLDYESMVAHNFIRFDKEKRLICKLVFSEETFQIITLPAPTLFDIHSGRYFVLPADIHAYWEGTRSPPPEPEPSPDPYQESIYQWDPQELANQWNPQDPPQYTGEGYFDPWA